jgi:Nucleotidyl transferase AbiEii toxin, Type IV TA system
MTRGKVTNLAASVHQRLLNRAQEHHDEPQLVLMRYGMERLLYRLSRSEYADEFVMKGALLFWVWTGDQYRPTKDLDLMTAQVRSAEQLETIFMKLCTEPVVEEDGLVFLALSVNVEEIREEDVYGGMRVTLEARLGRAKIPLQVDIGFGDAITPKAVVAEFPALLAMSAPRLAM